MLGVIGVPWMTQLNKHFESWFYDYEQIIGLNIKGPEYNILYFFYLFYFHFYAYSFFLILNALHEKLRVQHLNHH